MSDVRRQFAVEVVRQLKDAGHQSLWAGGCVRDLVMGNEPDDFDVATSARPDEVQGLFRRTRPVGVSFGVVLVVGRPEQGQIEVATFRTEGPYSDGRHPDRVEFSTAEADAQRFGLKEGDRVMLRSEIGSMEGTCRIAPIRAKNVQVHWPEGNVLISRRYDPVSGEPDYNTEVEINPLPR